MEDNIGFKYFDDYKSLAFITETEAACDICGLTALCFEPDTDELKYICPQCLYEKKLYDRKTLLNNGSYNELLSQVKEVYKDIPGDKQHELVKERTKQLEQATPQLVTWQNMDWPCLDGDYAKFIGYGSKALFTSLAKDGDGENLYKISLHADLSPYYTTEEWEQMLPGPLINTAAESSHVSPLVYVFKSLTTERLITWWDCI